MARDRRRERGTVVANEAVPPVQHAPRVAEAEARRIAPLSGEKPAPPSATIKVAPGDHGMTPHHPPALGSLAGKEKDA